MSMQQNVTTPTHSDAGTTGSATVKRRRSATPPAPPAQHAGHTGGSLTRVTANFTPRAIASLDRISGQTGDSRTDVLNMAVMAYETVLGLIADGDGRTLRVQLPDGEVRILQFIG
jgi:hypothetical protein